MRKRKKDEGFLACRCSESLAKWVRGAARKNGELASDLMRRALLRELVASDYRLNTTKPHLEEAEKKLKDDAERFA